MNKKDEDRLDMFAGIVLKQLIKTHYPEKFTPKEWAMDSYNVAQKMLEVKKELFSVPDNKKEKIENKQKDIIPDNYTIVDVEDEKDEEDV